MNANQVCKSFTAVMVLLVGVFVGEVGGAEALDNYNTCMATCNKDNNNPESNKAECPGTGLETAIACQKRLFKECKTKCGDDHGTPKEKRAECISAYKEWGTVASDGEAACGAFDRTLGQTCSQKVAACGRSIGKIFDEPKSDESNSGAEMLVAMAKAKMTSMAAPAKEEGGAAACVEQYDTKVARDAEKELKREQERLKKDIKTELDAQTKLYEDQRKKSIEIEKDIAKINKEMKKEGLKKDADMRKQLNDSAKGTLESAKKLRLMNTSITGENNKLAQLRFAHQTAMLALTDDKVALACRNQLLALKNGILKSGAIDPKAPESASIKAVADQIMNQGSKGTGNLKSLLSQAQKQCFETEKTKKSQKTLDYNQRLNEINNNIKDFQSQIAEEQKQLALSQDNLKKIQDESGKEKAQEQSDAASEIATLNKDLMLNDKTIQEKLKVSAHHAADLEASIKNLVLKTNADVKMAYTDASKAITKAENSRKGAYASCGCDKITAINKDYCSPLKDSSISAEPEAKKDDASKSTKAAE